MKVEELIEILNEVAEPEAECFVVFAEDYFESDKKYNLNFCTGSKKEVVFFADYDENE